MASINKIFTEASFFDIDPAKLRNACEKVPIRHFRPVFNECKEKYVGRPDSQEKAEQRARVHLDEIVPQYLIFTNTRIYHDGCAANAIGVGWVHDTLAVFAADNTSFEPPNQYLERLVGEQREQNIHNFTTIPLHQSMWLYAKTPTECLNRVATNVLLTEAMVLGCKYVAGLQCDVRQVPNHDFPFASVHGTGLIPK